MIGTIRYSSYGYAIGEHYVAIEETPHGTIYPVFVVIKRPRMAKHQSRCVAAFESSRLAHRWSDGRNKRSA